MFENFIFFLKFFIIPWIILIFKFIWWGLIIFACCYIIVDIFKMFQKKKETKLNNSTNGENIIDKRI